MCPGDAPNVNLTLNFPIYRARGNALFFVFASRLEESQWRVLFNLFNISAMFIMIKIRKLVTLKLFKLGQEENKQSVLRSVS